MRRPFIAIAILVFSALGSRAEAQQPVRDTLVYWYVSAFKIPFERIDSLRTLIRIYEFPVVEEAKRAGQLIERNYLVHDTGDEWNFVIVTKWRSWAAIRSDTSIAAARVRLMPDSANRAAVGRLFNWAFGPAEHRDNIYVERR
jgi:hypothetical protein